jgi:hypothetical protein
MRTISKNYLMLCAIHHPLINGKDNDSDPNIETHYLVIDRFQPMTGLPYSCINDDNDDTNDDFEYESDDDDIVKMDKTVDFLKLHYSNPEIVLQKYVGNHPTIRNYHNIVLRPDYIKPEIGEYIVLPTQEVVAILKTVWLRIIQRKWKKVFQERNNIIKNKCIISNLLLREVSASYFHLPGLRGMLSELNN